VEGLTVFHAVRQGEGMVNKGNARDATVGSKSWSSRSLPMRRYLLPAL